MNCLITLFHIHESHDDIKTIYACLGLLHFVLVRNTNLQFKSHAELTFETYSTIVHKLCFWNKIEFTCSSTKKMLIRIKTPVNLSLEDSSAIWSPCILNPNPNYIFSSRTKLLWTQIYIYTQEKMFLIPILNIFSHSIFQR